MKFVIMLVASCLALSDASILDMSRQLWSRALSGGFDRIGKLDPLIIPTVKIDQSEGNTSYRVFLRNLRIAGLNRSSIESVHIAKGKLKSNLSDGEAGYVNYNEQKDLDAIRYRFHTLVKERKTPSSEDESTEQFLEFDPFGVRVRKEDDIVYATGKESQRRRHDSRENESKIREKLQQKESNDDAVFEFNYGEGKVSLNTPQRNPSTVRIIYKNNGRPCIGACKQSPGTIETRNYNNQRENNSEQSYNFPASTQAHGSGVSFENPSLQRPSHFFVKTSQNNQRQFPDNSGIKAHRPNSSGIKDNNTEVTSRQPGSHQNQRLENVSGLKGHYSLSNIKESHNHGIKGQASHTPFEAIKSEVKGNHRYNNEQELNNYSIRDEIENIGFQAENPAISSNHRYNDNEEPGKSAHSDTQFQARIKGIKNDPQTQTSNPGLKYQGPQRDSLESYTYRPSQRDGSNANPITSNDQSGELRRSEVSHGLRNRYSQPIPVQYIDAVYPPHYPPAFRIEQQPGYIDIEYASKTQSRKLSPQPEEPQSAADDDPKKFKIEVLQDAAVEYPKHNFTKGKPLNHTETYAKRIEELERYAGNYEEKDGFYEEGVELIYHFGKDNSTSANDETLIRKKRQHVHKNKEEKMDEEKEEDLMHVIVKVRVPRVSVDAMYALTGKVGKQVLRGSGLLGGNFIDVTAVFTVELKKVDDKTMLVRAVRARLESIGSSIELEGMDEKGLVKPILKQGLMAAEAVAAMVADDLASKTLNEQSSAQTTIYKMYRDEPLIERA